MKTKEFVETLFNKHQNFGQNIELVGEGSGKRVEIEGENLGCVIGLNAPYFSINITQEIPQVDLLKLIFEYVNTPIEERKEEHKYKLRLKGIMIDQSYLNQHKIENEFLISNDTSSEIYKMIFTQSEIDNFPEEIKKHNWEYIEVGHNHEG